jgi:hypothetical protein
MINLCHSFIFRGRLKSPWSRRKRKHALSPQQWRSLFTPDGKFRDGGVKFLKKVRSGVSYHSSHLSYIFAPLNNMEFEVSNVSLFLLLDDLSS